MIAYIKNFFRKPEPVVSVIGTRLDRYTGDYGQSL